MGSACMPKEQFGEKVAHRVMLELCQIVKRKTIPCEDLSRDYHSTIYKKLTIDWFSDRECTKAVSSNHTNTNEIFWQNPRPFIAWSCETARSRVSHPRQLVCEVTLFDNCTTQTYRKSYSAYHKKSQRKKKQISCSVLRPFFILLFSVTCIVSLWYFFDQDIHNDDFRETYSEHRQYTNKNDPHTHRHWKNQQYQQNHQHQQHQHQQNQQYQQNQFQQQKSDISLTTRQQIKLYCDEEFRRANDQGIKISNCYTEYVRFANLLGLSEDCSRNELKVKRKAWLKQNHNDKNPSGNGEVVQFVNSANDKVQKLFTQLLIRAN